MFILVGQQIYNNSKVISISKYVLTKLIEISTLNLSNVFVYISNTGIDRYKNELEYLDIDFKLKYIKKWLDKNNSDETNIIYDGILEVVSKLNDQIENINDKIIKHNNKWFNNWRSINLDNEIEYIKKYTNILNERLKLININI